MSERTVIQIYTTDENREWLEQLADEEDTSISEYGHEMIEDHIDRETGERQYGRYGTDTEIEVILDSLKEELGETLDQFESETLEEVRHIQRVRTAYLISIWKLIKDDYSTAEQQLAMKFAERFTGQELNTESEAILPSESSSSEDGQGSAGAAGDGA
mgnify:CR=1 FL=1